MSVLSWDKPEQIMSTEDWKSISADCAPPGVYTSNMSWADMKKWKAKLIKGKYTRVEIRKTAGSQILIIVSLPGQATRSEKSWTHKDPIDVGQSDNVRMSMNGPSDFTYQQIEELQQAVSEAKTVLEALGKKTL